MQTGRVHSTESFGSVDGPGIRFLIFLQGCAMRCRYCHNPDTWATDGGEIKTVGELLDTAEKYRAYWGKEGGVTVSGGEPLLQIDFLIDLFTEAKRRGIHTCIDTAGQPFTRNEPFISKFRALCALTDLFLVDIKHIDPGPHRQLTGRDNANILELLTYLSKMQKPVWIRQVLLPGVTDDEAALIRTRAFLDTLENIQKVEVLPYHSFGAYKWEELGIPYTLSDALPPTKEQVERAEKILGICR